MPYHASPIKRRRRSKADIAAIRDGLREIVLTDAPMTVRQVFYRAVAAGLIDKTEGEYNNTVVRLLRDMRLDGDLPFSAIADNTRWIRRPRSFSGLEEAVMHTARFYRRKLWDGQDERLEIWTEKDALAGVMVDITDRWDVPLMVCRGYVSWSFVHQVVETYREDGRPWWLYYFGDHDPSGLDIQRDLERKVREMAPDADVHFIRAAVLPNQIESWRLPHRPTKGSDSRAAGFPGDSVDVDAIPPNRLRQLVEDCIQFHIDPDQLAVVEAAERSEQSLLMAWAQQASSPGLVP